MNRLAALFLLLLTLSPAWAVAGELACAPGAIEIGSATAVLTDEALAPRATSAKLLYGGSLFNLEGSDVPPSSQPAALPHPHHPSSAALASGRYPAAEGCTPHAQRLPYHATAPPAAS